VATAWQQTILLHAVDDHQVARTANRIAHDRPAPSRITAVQLRQVWLCRAKSKIVVRAEPAQNRTRIEHGGRTARPTRTGRPSGVAVLPPDGAATSTCSGQPAAKPGPGGHQTHRSMTASTAGARLGAQAPGVLARRWWTDRTALEPSPTAAATRFIDPWRTSPAANTPASDVSKGRALKTSRLVPPSSWRSVRMKPSGSSSMAPSSHPVSGRAPMKENRPEHGIVSLSPVGVLRSVTRCRLSAPGLRQLLRL
jgi:hypothetical protein